MMIRCAHAQHQKYGRNRKGQQRHRCTLRGHVWFDAQPKPLGTMRVPIETAKLALRLLVEGMSIRATERTTDLHRDTICKLIVHYGDACQRFLDERMQGLTLSHLQFDEQWTFVAKKQSRLTMDDRAERHPAGFLEAAQPADSVLLQETAEP